MGDGRRKLEGKALLGIDLGTSAVKALVLEATSGRRLGEGRAAYPLLTRQPGWAEGEPEEWWRQTVAAVRMALRRLEPDQVAAIGVTGQMHGIVPVDAAGNPVRAALLWPDQRAVGQLARFEQLPVQLRERLANPFAPGMAGPLLCWLADEEPETFARMRWALQPKDWLRLRLTGTVFTEASDASATLLYDVPGDRWATEVMDSLGLRRELFAPLLPAGAAAGYLQASAAKELGLKPGLPVATGAADVAASLLGAGLLAPGPLLLSLGSGAQFVLLCQEPRPDPQWRTHLYRAADGRHWYRMAAVQNAGLALDWVRRTLQASWLELYASSESEVTAVEPLFFLPCLTPERPYHPRPRAAGWLHLRLDHERDHLLRAALEGVAFGMRLALEALAEGAEVKEQLLVVGGGGLHPGWRQMLADILGSELWAVAEKDTAVRGAALLAGLAAGCWEDVTILETWRPPVLTVTAPGARRAAYQERYQRYRELLLSPAAAILEESKAFSARLHEDGGRADQS
uniref:Sugar kinase n=1 Tax=Thermogemmatispora argillosa TaxID=2045280 RepID=A0A455SXD4_9CHLR|nr:sugar kinase [Thermogemmatispora argillosa]